MQEATTDIVKIIQPFPLLAMKRENGLTEKDYCLFIHYLTDIDPHNKDTWKLMYPAEQWKKIYGGHLTKNKIEQIQKRLTTVQATFPVFGSYYTKRGKERALENGLREEDLETEVTASLFQSAYSERAKGEGVRYGLLINNDVAHKALDDGTYRFAVGTRQDIDRVCNSKNALSLFLFLQLKHYDAIQAAPKMKDGGVCVVSVAELREKLGMEGKSYDDYGAFNRELLKASDRVNKDTTLKHIIAPIPARETHTKTITQMKIIYTTGLIPLDAPTKKEDGNEQ